MPLRRYKVIFRDGTSEMIEADSLDQAWKKARRSAKQQISVRQQGRKVVDTVEAGEVRTERSVRAFHPFGIGSAEYNRKHSVNPRTGMPRK